MRLLCRWQTNESASGRSHDAVSSTTPFVTQREIQEAEINLGGVSYPSVFFSSLAHSPLAHEAQLSKRNNEAHKAAPRCVPLRVTQRGVVNTRFNRVLRKVFVR